MKLTIATAFIAASASAPSISASRVAASILEHENNKRSIDTVAKKQGVECALADRITVRKSADVGVLSCGVGEVCVEDSTSTMGGRCDVLVPDNDEAAALEPQRELHEECEKCMGNNACSGVVDQSGIGCGSCIGIYACADLASDVTIGDNSCVGELACDRASGEFNIVRLVGNKKSANKDSFVNSTISAPAPLLFLFHSQRGRRQLVSFGLTSETC